MCLFVKYYLLTAM